MTDDAELLRTYAESGSEPPFAELVRRHVDLVHAIALRQCLGDTALAEDVTQRVFVDLARNARRLSNHPALVGWLHTATRFAAMNLQRSERRRIQREQEALAQEPATADPPLDWNSLRPLIDPVLGELKERERAAVLLRYFEGKSLQEVGDRLKLSEPAARSCVDRALEKMRVALQRRGVTSATGALAVALANQVSAAAPAGLAASATAAAVSAGAATGVTLASIFAMKSVVFGTAGLLMVAALATGRVELSHRRELLTAHVQLQQGSAVAPAVSAEAAVRVRVASGPDASEAPHADPAEAARLRERLARLEARPPGIVDGAMRSPANAGRKTAREAKETLSWAVRTGDLKLLEALITFGDDTPENREAFLKDFGPAVRARYATPEELLVAINFAESLRDPPVAEQVMDVQSDALGIQRVTAWTQYASGREVKTTLPFQEAPGGWSLTAVWLTGPKSPRAWLRSRLDLASGDVRPVVKTP